MASCCLKALHGQRFVDTSNAVGRNLCCRGEAVSWCTKATMSASFNTASAVAGAKPPSFASVVQSLEVSTEGIRSGTESVDSQTFKLIRK